MSLEESITATVETALNQALAKLTARLDALERVRSAPPQLLYREEQAAKLLDISHATLKKWRCAGRVKSHSPPGSRTPCYTMGNLEAIAGQIGSGELGT